jgi:hypothetical protein
MFDWNTGRGNARADVLKMLLRHCNAGTMFVATSVTAGPIVARALLSTTGSHPQKVLLINSSHRKQVSLLMRRNFRFTVLMLVNLVAEPHCIHETI